MRRFVVAAALAVLASSAFAGVTYNYSSTTEGMAHTALDGKVAIEGSHLRMDMAHGDGMLFKDGAILLSTDGGKTLRVLDPGSKTYYDLELSQLLGAGNSALSQLGAALKIDNPKVNVVDEGDGGNVEGFATKRSRVDSSYDMNVEMMGQKMTTHMSIVTESWTTDKIPAAAMTFFQLKGTHTGIAAIDKLIEAQSGAFRNRFPLKQVATVKINAMGQEMTTTTTSSVTDVKNVTVPATQFDMPAGYTKGENPLDRIMANMKTAAGKK